MMTDFVDIHGNPINLHALAQKHKPKPKAQTGPKTEHNGWRVIGHYKGECETAHKLNVAGWAAWNAHTAEQRAQALRDRKRPPEMWDEQAWRMRTKKHYVRSRPYEVLAAAEECKALALREGWEDVEIIALVKGDAPPPGMF